MLSPWRTRNGDRGIGDGRDHSRVRTGVTVRSRNGYLLAEAHYGLGAHDQMRFAAGLLFEDPRGVLLHAPRPKFVRKSRLACMKGIGCFVLAMSVSCGSSWPPAPA